MLCPWRQRGGDAWPAWLGAIDGFNEKLGVLLNDSKSSFCPQSNLSSGLTKLLMALPWSKPTKTILMHSSAFPSMGFVVSALASHGFTLKLIDDNLPAEDIESWRSQLTDDVDLMLVTHVHSNTGALSPVAPLVKLAREKGCYVVVDIAQSVGVVPIDLTEWQADAVLGSCVKWLCGGPGAGFMWVNPALIESCQPVDVGWFSHHLPFEFDIRHFAYHQTALRFWGGTPSVAPYALASAGIDSILSLGVNRISAHNQALQSRILGELGPYLSRPLDADSIGGTLCLSFSPEQAEKGAARLSEKGAFYDRRGETFRLSLHIYNDERDASLIIEAFGD